MIGVIFQMVDGPMVFSGKDRPYDDGFVVVTTMWLFCLVNGNHNHYIRKIFRTIRFNKLACAMLNFFFWTIFYRYITDLFPCASLSDSNKSAVWAANLINTIVSLFLGKKRAAGLKWNALRIVLIGVCARSPIGWSLPLDAMHPLRCRTKNNK